MGGKLESHYVGLIALTFGVSVPNYNPLSITLSPVGALIHSEQAFLNEKYTNSKYFLC